MKKILTLALAIATLFAFSSCRKENLEDNSSSNGIRVITAEFENNGTRTTLDTDGKTPLWKEDDVIRVLSGNDHQDITLRTDNIKNGGKSITFTTRLSGTLYAVYPASVTTMESCSGSIDFTIPSNQDGTFASANICVAKSSTTDGTSKDNLVFSNATSVLEFSQTAASTSVMRVAVTAANAIAGKLTATFGDDNKATISTSGLTRRIIWTTAPSTAQDKYYIAIAPVTTGAVNFVYNTILDEASVNKNSYTLVRNKIYELTIPTEGYVNSYVIIGNKKWAKYNLGATAVATSREICYGDYYMWGATELAYESLSGNNFTFKSSIPASYSNTTWDSTKGFVWENCNYTDGVFDRDNNKKNVFTKYTTDDAYARSGQKDGLGVLEDIDDVVKQKIDHGWRMPTKDDFAALVKDCKPDYSSGDITPTIADNAEGVSAQERGIYYCSNYSAGDGIVGLLFCDGLNNKLFFPAAGYAHQLSLFNHNEGNYWSSTLDSSPDEAYGFNFSNTSVNPQFGGPDRSEGFSVRPVLD